MLVSAALLIMWAGRQVEPLGDQWEWIFGALRLNADTILEDFNGHLLATTWGANYALLSTFGLPQYWIYRVLALALHLGVALLVFLLARRRIGPWPALAPTAAIAFLGTGSDVFLSGLNIGIVGATASCLAALVMLDRRTRRADFAACALLLIGLASFTSAVAFTAGVYVEVLRQRDRWRRIWVPLVPTSSYLTWRLIWGGSPAGDVTSSGGVADVLRDSFEAATGAIAGLAGVQLLSPTVKAHLPWIDSLARVAVALGLMALLWRFRRRDVGARLANLMVTGAVLWLLIALGRGSSYDLYESRYVYLGAIVVTLIAVELASGVRIRGHGGARAVVLGVAVMIALNVGWLVVWANHLRRESTRARAELAALDIARGRAPPQFQPSRRFTLRDVTARDYFEAVREFGGSPAMTYAELRRASEADREAADRVLVRALGLKLASRPSPALGRPPVIERLSGARVLRANSCLRLTPIAPVAKIDFIARSPSGVLVETRGGGSPLLHARRFGDRFTVEVGRLRTGPATLETPLGRARDPWHLRLVSNTRTSICARRPQP